MENWPSFIGNALLVLTMFIAGLGFLFRLERGLALLKQEVTSIKDDMHTLAETSTTVAAMAVTLANCQSRIAELDRTIERQRHEFEGRLSQMWDIFNLFRHRMHIQHSPSPAGSLEDDGQ